MPGDSSCVGGDSVHHTHSVAQDKDGCVETVVEPSVATRPTLGAGPTLFPGLETATGRFYVELPASPAAAN
jgi:hypothetical protein